MPHVISPLPYPLDALEPHLDAATLALHYGEVHAGDVERLNRALAGTRWAERPVEETLRRLPEILDGPITGYRRSKARAFGGSHLAHTLMWQAMAPAGRGGGGAPAGPLAEAIEADIGSFTRLLDRVTRAGLALVGSGWVWLAQGPDGLRVLTTERNDTPLDSGERPLLGLDLWEHAHLLHYGTDRAAYLEACLELVRWDVVSARAAAASARRLP